MSETKLDIAKLRELEAKAASIGPSTIVVKCVNGVHYSFVHGGDYDSLSPEENGRIFAFASGLLANAPSLLAAAEERDRLRAALERIKALGMGGGPFSLGHAWNIADEVLREVAGKDGAR